VGNEIATSVISWLQLRDKEEEEHIILYSDTCGGQNRNKVMCTARGPHPPRLVGAPPPFGL